MTKSKWPRIAGDIKKMIREKRLAHGDPLPPVRKLADRYKVSPVTVSRAYRELELSGWVEGRLGAGMFVACHPPDRPPLSVMVGRIDEAAAASHMRLNPWGTALSFTRRRLKTPVWGEKPPDRKAPDWRRRRLATRFRAAVVAARWAGLTPEETERLFRAAFTWEKEIPALASSLHGLSPADFLTSEDGSASPAGRKVSPETMVAAILLQGVRPRSYRTTRDDHKSRKAKNISADLPVEDE